MKMRWLILVTCFVFTSGPLLSSQETQAQARQSMKSLVLQPAEMDRIEKVLAADENSLIKDRAEMQVLQARLSRLLLEADPSMDQVKSILAESLN